MQCVDFHGKVSGSKKASRLFHYRNAAAAPGSAGNVRSLRQSTQVEKNFAQPRTVFQIHIDKFKGHGLRTCAAYNRLRLDGADTLRELQSDQRSWRKMPFSGADSAAEI